MESIDSSVIVVGGGIFGVTAALELRSRGYTVTLLDPGPLPHPDASSNDISKVLRMDYGKDEFYTDLMLDSFEIWDRWNESWERPLYHQTGFLMMSKDNWEPGGFEYDSYQVIEKKNLPSTRINEKILRGDYPMWHPTNYPEGYFNPRAGWAESGEVVSQLIQDCKKSGVNIVEGETFLSFIENGSKVNGIRSKEGGEYKSDFVVIALGSWTSAVIPSLEKYMWAVGQPVFHFKVENPKEYQPPHFPVWNADIGHTGWYGFPAKDDGILKVANHGPGWRVDPKADRVIPNGEEERFREFFSETFPSLVDAPKVYERLCLYCDTWDGNFWIDHDPEREGVIICAGGSGHGFKFAPMLGKITADVLERKPNKYSSRFAWRDRGELNKEDARFMDNNQTSNRK